MREVIGYMMLGMWWTLFCMAGGIAGAGGALVVYGLL